MKLEVVGTMWSNWRSLGVKLQVVSESGWVIGYAQV